MGKETMMTWMIANLQNGAGVPTVLVEKTTIYQQDGKQEGAGFTKKLSASYNFRYDLLLIG